MGENSSVVCDQSNLRAYSIEKRTTMPVIEVFNSAVDTFENAHAKILQLQLKHNFTTNS